MIRPDFDISVNLVSLHIAYADNVGIRHSFDVSVNRAMVRCRYSLGEN